MGRGSAPPRISPKIDKDAVSLLLSKERRFLKKPEVSPDRKFRPGESLPQAPVNAG